MTALAARGALSSKSGIAALDIAIANYFSACLFLFVVARLIGAPIIDRSAPPLRRYGPAGLLKALNAVLFISALSTVTAGFAAALENLYVLWAAIPLVIVARSRVVWRWLSAAILVVVGASLIAVRGVNVGQAGLLGVGLAIMAGVVFALYGHVWSEGARDRDDSDPTQRHDWKILVSRTAGMLSAALVALVVTRLLATAALALLGQGVATIDFRTALIQLGNGVPNIGFSFLFMTAALRAAAGERNLGVAAVALGMSLAVPASLVFGRIILGTPLGIRQGVGAAVFAAGFALAQVTLLRHEVRTG